MVRSSADEPGESQVRDGVQGLGPVWVRKVDRLRF